MRARNDRGGCILINISAILQAFCFRLFLLLFITSPPKKLHPRKGGEKEGEKNFQGLMTRGERQRGDCLLNATRSRAGCLFCPPKLFHHNVHSPVLPLSPPAAPKRASLTSELSYSNPLSFKINQQAPLFSLVILISVFISSSNFCHRNVQSVVAHLNSKW